MTRFRLLFGVATLVATLLLSGCGGDAASPTAIPIAALESTATDTPRPTNAPTVGLTATPRPYTIFLDAGHGGKDPGAVHNGADGRPDLVEKEVNLDVVKRIGALLTANGFAVLYSRETDALLTAFDGPNDRENRRVEIQARVDLANKAKADLFISVHFNGHSDPAAAGTEVYYCADRPFAAKSKALAQMTLDAMVKELAGIGYRTTNRGIHDDYGVQWPGYHYFALGPGTARPSEMPGILGEGLFVTNDTEAALLAQDRTRQAMARAYSQAITAYFQSAPTATVIANLPLTITQAPRAALPPTPTGRPVTAAPAPTGRPVTGTATPTPKSTSAVPRELVQGDKTKHQMALTFDAGASSQSTGAILDALKAAGLRSTLFLTGDWIKENPTLVQRIVADGHQVANHTMSHPDLKTLTDAQIQEQLLSAGRLFKASTGLDMAPYFRPPFGSRDSRVLQAAWKAGYRSVYWTLDSGDWKADATPEGVRKTVLGGAQNGAIVVMHLGSAQTAQVLPQIIASLRAAGYGLVTVDNIE